MGKSTGHNVKAEEMLENRGVRITPVRLLILDIIAASTRPVSAQEIEEKLETVDRSSITRTLATFSDHDIIHRISDGSGAQRYELCIDTTTEKHQDQHAHFHCNRCGKTYCLPDIPLSIPLLPDNYLPESMTCIISGICPACQHIS